MVVDTRERDKCARVDDADHTLDELGGGARGIGFDRGHSKERNRGRNDENRGYRGGGYYGNSDNRGYRGGNSENRGYRGGGYYGRGGGRHEAGINGAGNEGGQESRKTGETATARRAGGRGEGHGEEEERDGKCKTFYCCYKIQKM